MEQIKLENQVKVCSKCKRALALSAFSKHKEGKYGVTSRCKECVRNISNARNRAKGMKQRNYIEHIEVEGILYKECPKCKNLLTVDCFYLSNKESDGLRSECITCGKRYRETNRVEILLKQKRHFEENREAYYNNFHRRRQRKKTAKIGDQKKCEAIIKECRRLNKEAGFIKYHVDHIFPLQAKDSSGLHCWWNLRVILATDNLSKNNKVLPEDVEAYKQELLTKFGG